MLILLISAHPKPAWDLQDKLYNGEASKMTLCPVTQLIFFNYSLMTHRSSSIRHMLSEKMVPSFDNCSSSDPLCKFLPAKTSLENPQDSVPYHSGSPTFPDPCVRPPPQDWLQPVSAGPNPLQMTSGTCRTPSSTKVCVLWSRRLRFTSNSTVSMPITRFFPMVALV